MPDRLLVTSSSSDALIALNDTSDSPTRAAPHAVAPTRFSDGFETVDPYLPAAVASAPSIAGQASSSFRSWPGAPPSGMSPRYSDLAPPSYDAAAGDARPVSYAPEKAKNSQQAPSDQINNRSLHGAVARTLSSATSGIQKIITQAKVASEAKQQVAALADAALAAQKKGDASLAYSLYKSVIAAATTHNMSLSTLLSSSSSSKDALDVALECSNNFKVTLLLLDLYQNKLNIPLCRKFLEIEDRYALSCRQNEFADRVERWIARHAAIVRTMMLTGDDITTSSALKELIGVTRISDDRAGPSRKIWTKISKRIDDAEFAAFAIAKSRHATQTLSCLLAHDRDEALRWLLTQAQWTSDLTGTAQIIDYACHEGFGGDLARHWHFFTPAAEIHCLNSMFAKKLRDESTRPSYLSFLDGLAESRSDDGQKFTMLMTDDAIAPLLSDSVKQWISGRV